MNDHEQRGFYITLAIIASSLALYKYSRSSSGDPADAGDPAKQPFLTRFIHRWDSIQEEFSRRNITQVKWLEAAGRDRQLFEGQRPTGHVELKFPEWVESGLDNLGKDHANIGSFGRIFNTGSPRNVVAGSQPNLDKLYEHYEQEREEAQAQRIERLKRRTGSQQILGDDGNDKGESSQKNVFAKLTETFGGSEGDQNGEK